VSRTLTIDFDSADTPTIRKFWQCDSFLRALIGPFGSGKSSGCLMELIRRAAKQAPGQDGIRRTRWAVIRNTYQQLQDTTVKTVLDWLPAEHFGQWWKSTHDYNITRLPGIHIELMFRALDRPDQVANLLSAEYTGAWVNEAREVPWSVIEALQGRVGRYPASKDGGCTWSGVILDTNPPDTDSKMFHVFEEVRPPNATVFKQPSGLSPEAENRTHLPANYYENLAMGKTDDFIKVYIHGEYGYVQDGKPVFPEYNDTIHCAECQPTPGLPIRRGWDFGLTPACTFSQMQASGRWIVFDELVSDSMGIDRFSDNVLIHVNQRYSGFKFEDFGDPAGEQRSQTDEKTCFQIMRAKGINVQASEQSPALRIESVRKPLMSLRDGKPAFLLDPRCKMLRKGFLGKYRYRRMQTSSERYTDQPDKNEYSHCADALSYDAARLFGPTLRGYTEKLKPIKYPSLGIV
jgi:hypothetical protein